MRLLPLSVLIVLTLSACDTAPTAQFWRPISEPNMLMPSDREQTKLSFDLGQCRCGIYPSNVSHQEVVSFQKDKQRLAETGVTITPDEEPGQCSVKPSLVVAECMRERGWEPTSCSGRMPLPGGGALCASFVPDATLSTKP